MNFLAVALGAVCDQPHAGKGGISGADADH